MKADFLLRPGLGILDGVIIEATSARRRLNSGGLDILPGIIDVHGDAFERAIAPRPGVMMPFDIAFAELEAWLLAAGVTTAYLAVTLSWEAGLRSAATYILLRDALLARPAGALPDLKLHLRFEAHNLDALDLALADIEAGHVAMLSFNDHTPSMVRKLGRPAAIAKIVERAGQTHEQFVADASRAGAQPAGAIADARTRLATAARAANIPMASHDDPDPAARAAFRALGATICEFPAATSAAQDAILHGEHVVMGAPNVVRGGSHTGWHSAEAAIAQGICTALCSDYVYAALLHAAYHLARNNSCTLEQATALISTNPAQLANLTDRGTLAPGQRADVILVKPGPTPQLIAAFAAGRLAYTAPGVALD